MQISWGTNARKKRGDTRQNVQRTQPKFTTRDVTDKVREALEPVAAKEISEASGSSVKAAQNAKQGLNAMSLAHFFNAARQIPELKALALELMGCETEIDPEFERGMSMLMNSYARRNGNPPPRGA